MNKFNPDNPDTMICKECGLHWGRHYGDRCPDEIERRQQEAREDEAHYQKKQQEREKKRQEPYKVGALLRKHDGGFFRLIRYKPCLNDTDRPTCPLRSQCGGQSIIVQKLFDKFDNPRLAEYCPINWDGGMMFAMMFAEIKVKGNWTGVRSIVLGEGWV